MRVINLTVLLFYMHVDIIYKMGNDSHDIVCFKTLYLGDMFIGCRNKSNRWVCGSKIYRALIDQLLMNESHCSIKRR